MLFKYDFYKIMNLIIFCFNVCRFFILQKVWFFLFTKYNESV